MILSMEPVESLRYLDWLSTEGVLITSSEPFVNIPNYPEVENIYNTIKKLPKSHIVNSKELAKEAGNARTENMVLIGTALKYVPVKEETVLASIRERFQKKDPALVEANAKALELGAKA